MASNETKYQLIGASGGEQAEDLLTGLNDHDSRQRLQALIAEWLRMENLVVLTAAGTSVDCGGKLMGNLEEAVSQSISAIEDPSMDEAKKLVGDRSLGNFLGGEEYEWATTGYEEWLSYLTNIVHLGQSEKSPIIGMRWKADNTDSIPIESIAQLLDYTAKAIYAECALELPDVANQKRNDSTIAPHLAFLSKLVARDSQLGRTHFFTLNYDTLFEQALEVLGIQYFDGFTGRANARFDPSVYGLDVYYPGEVAEGRVRRFDKFLHFYKLHGSIHWRTSGDKLIARHGDLSKYSKYRMKEPKEKAEDLMIDGFAYGHKEFGILPTSNKFIQTLDMPYAHLFRALHTRLAAPQTFLLVIGYGFGDDHVTRIIETALMNPSLIMLVVEPNPGSQIIKKIKQYKELGKRAFILTATKEAFEKDKFKYATFDDFAKSVMPDVQWLDDFLRLRRFEKQLAKEMPGSGLPSDDDIEV